MFCSDIWIAENGLNSPMPCAMLCLYCILIICDLVTLLCYTSYTCQNKCDFNNVIVYFVQFNWCLREWMEMMQKIGRLEWVRDNDNNFTCAVYSNSEMLKLRDHNQQHCSKDNLNFLWWKKKRFDFKWDFHSDLRSAVKREQKLIKPLNLLSSM